MSRRSPRLTTTTSSLEDGVAIKDSKVATSNNECEQNTAHAENEIDDDMTNDDETADDEQTYEFNGTRYKTYQDMVQAKRQYNEEILKASGLLEAVRDFSTTKKRSNLNNEHGLKKRKQTSSPSNLPRRKSNRLQGISSDGRSIEDERSGKFTIISNDGITNSNDMAQKDDKIPCFYGNRVNDGSDISLDDAANKLVNEKWMTEDATTRAKLLFRSLSSTSSTSPVKVKLSTLGQDTPSEKASPRMSPNCVSANIVEENNQGKDVSTSTLMKPHHSFFDGIAAKLVAKVVPERIYGMAVHPSLDQLLVCAGDKVGYIGLWKVPQNEDESDRAGESNSGGGDKHPPGNEKYKEENDTAKNVHLFKYHSSPVTSLQWTPNGGQTLFSTSYDGTARIFDVVSQKVRCVFAAYDNSAPFLNTPGYDLDDGESYWTQFGCLDIRHPDDCYFLSTSLGQVYHLDTRISGRAALTWKQTLSARKINSVSLHPNGFSLATGGLDCKVSLWDLRTFGKLSNRQQQKPVSVATYHGKKSINSAFFSPSGHSLISTTMNNTIDIVKDFHLQRSSSSSNSSSRTNIKATQSIRHDNMTGRWLTTFQAIWHPSLEIFGVGSMSRPRVVDLFDGITGERRCAVGGDVLTAVASRLAFHPRTDQPLLAGGNSSGRVTIFR